MAFLKAVSDASVSGITMLNVHSAVCVIFWAKTPVNAVLKAAMVGLPFSVFPILLLTRSIMKLVVQGGCNLDMGATLVLLEFIYFGVEVHSCLLCWFCVFKMDKFGSNVLNWLLRKFIELTWYLYEFG